jgi:hypothetical protein
MADDEVDLRTFRTARRTEARLRRRSDMLSTVIGSVVAGVLGDLAFRTWAHALLFAFVVFSISVVGNRVIWALQDSRDAEDERRLTEGSTGLRKDG